jgi:hypothetical protein
LGRLDAVFLFRYWFEAFGKTCRNRLPSMALHIPSNDKLSPEEARVEMEFSAAIQADLEAFVKLYGDRFGRVIDTDRARELWPAYSASDAARTRWSRAVYNPAKALADEIYRRTIREAAPGAGQSILFTSGGIGVGKSTALAQLSGDNIPPEERYDILVDGTLSDLSAARTKVRLALALGHSVTIIHVHRAFLETIPMIVQRAIEMGRTVTLDNIAATHFRSRESLLKLVEEFGEQIEVEILENSAADEVRSLSLAQLASVPGKEVDDLRKQAHAFFQHEFGHLETSHPGIYTAFLQADSRF